MHKNWSKAKKIDFSRKHNPSRASSGPASWTDTSNQRIIQLVQNGGKAGEKHKRISRPITKVRGPRENWDTNDMGSQVVLWSREPCLYRLTLHKVRPGERRKHVERQLLSISIPDSVQNTFTSTSMSELALIFHRGEKDISTKWGYLYKDVQ